MPTARTSSSHGSQVLNSRVQRSMEGWSIIEKIVDFTHAVCRVTDGRGSAILIAIPQQQYVPVPHESMEESRLCHERTERERVGVLLTTTMVFPTRDEARGATVTFLEQTVVGTNAVQRRCVEPFEVAVRADKLFVCSASGASPRQSMRERPAFMSSWKRQERFGGIEGEPGSDQQLHGEDKDGDEDEEHELGYVLTLCDMTPLNGGKLHHVSNNVPLTSRGLNFSIPSETDAAESTSPGLPPPSEGLPSWMNRSDASLRFGATLGSGGNMARPPSHLGETTPIKPLPLPLLLSRIAPVCPGDNHLMIAHKNGRERHYVVQKVKRVGDDSCEYEFFDPTCEFSSGGPIFNMQGDFVGLQHQSGDRSYGIFISSIVRHLFQSMVLGICSLPIVDKNGEAEKKFDQTKAVPDEVFNQPFHFNQRYCVLNVGSGDQLIDYEEFKRMRLRSDIRGSTQPPSLVAPEAVLVWNELYTDFHSLILILHAFSHSPMLVKLAMVEMASYQHRQNLPNVATLGGIGITLEIIDGYPQNEEVVLAAVNLLSHASLYKTNRESISRCDGLLTLLGIMSEYPHHASIQHRGFHCLFNLMAVDSPVRTGAVSLFVQCHGIPLAIGALRMHWSDRHVMRHTSFALSSVAREGRGHICIMLRSGIGGIIVEGMRRRKDDAFIFVGLAALLRGILHHVLQEDESAAVDSTVPSTEISEDAPLNDATARVIAGNVGKKCCNEELMNAFFLDLLKGCVFTVLGRVMASASRDKYSSLAMLLLEECIESVMVMLLCCFDAVKDEVLAVDLRQTCTCIIRNFPTDAAPVASAKKIVSMFSWTM